ncbi:uncharacterized protein L203_103861 [Cryptococcus depauperatus CBS 7841]|uniref:Uncharacterized protein n=1 Tax=Cryptococcus depauperatus CBS 7841 TaxID=1295531 RepID=A0A1E3IG19_9TREE|nr:hypothetical protein L203_03639 [Cryptococcus depauperatus CBS 7841]
MSKALESSVRPDNSSGNPRPPPYRRVAKISATLSLPSDPQASGTSIDPPASMQSRTAQISVGTRATAPLNPQGRRYWLDVRKDWDNDATLDSKSSFELLLDWLDLPNNWQRFAAGLEGCSATEASKQCSTWLASNFCPTKRTPKACRRKLNEMHNAFYRANDYRNGTGVGGGQYWINKAQGDDERARIAKSVDDHCERLCPGFFRLGLVYKEGDFGQQCYRSDSTLSVNPAVSGFKQDLHALEAQRDAAFTGEITSAAPEDKGTDIMDELREIEAHEIDRGSSMCSMSSTSQTSVSDRAHSKRPWYDVFMVENMRNMADLTNEYRAKKLRLQEERMEIERERRQEEKDERRVQLIRQLAGDLMTWKAPSDNMSYLEAWAKAKDQVEAMRRGPERHAHK